MVMLLLHHVRGTNKELIQKEFLGGFKTAVEEFKTVCPIGKSRMAK